MLTLTDILKYITGEQSKNGEELSIYDFYQEPLGLSKEECFHCIWHSCYAFLILLTLHAARFQWPKSWYDRKNKYCTSCYDEMFSEPLSYAANDSDSCARSVLIAKYGNTLSNLLYLASGLCITRSVVMTWDANVYALADGLFGINLLLLSLFSTIWHAANYNKEHYFDLWTMVIDIICMFAGEFV